MSAKIDQSGELETGDMAEPAPACTALVPVVQSQHLPPSTEHLTRPDPSFVTQLIATAEHVPQTCALRRATPAVAQAAYGSTSNQPRIKLPGCEMRQLI